MEEKSRKTGLEKMSIRQMEYLLKLDEHGNGRGAIQQVADALGIKTPTVSRFFKECTEEGYLTEELSFTEKGRRLLEWHKRVEHDVRHFYQNLGIEKGLDGLVKGAMEHLDYNTLEEIVTRPAAIKEEIQSRAASEEPEDIRNLLKEGRYPVFIAVFQIALGNMPGKAKKSMADRGFARMAELVCERDEAYIELTILEMQAVSRIDGREMTGRLSSLRYLYHGVICDAKICKDKVRIPLDACQYQKFDGGIIWGSVPITVSCSAGPVHMPESTSRLLFIL